MHLPGWFQLQHWQSQCHPRFTCVIHGWSEYRKYRYYVTPNTDEPELCRIAKTFPHFQLQKTRSMPSRRRRLPQRGCHAAPEHSDTDSTRSAPVLLHYRCRSFMAAFSCHFARNLIGSGPCGSEQQLELGCGPATWVLLHL